ncbi:MAG: VWA domain-containing protein [Atopobiaceae bacterium]|nr:VWA domain-containing protein [Atopobiaceae bacterium]
MPYRNDLGAVMRPDLHVFYVLDTSGSMQNKPIGVLNRAMDETVDALKQVAAHHSDANVKIAVLEFNSTCRWINPAGPEYVDDFFWQDLAAAGRTEVGAALRELDSKLSRNAFLNSMSSAYLPVIIFMTDGFATDDYEHELNRILHNKWFAKATRVGFAIGRNPDTEMIAKLVGSSEAVIRTDDLGVFARLLRFVSVSASTLSGNSHTTDEEVSGSAAVKMARDMAGVSREEVSPSFTYEETPFRDFNSDSSGTGFTWDSTRVF